MELQNVSNSIKNYLQVSFIATKKALRKKTDDIEMTGNLRGAAQVSAIKPENIWDLITVHGFLEALCRYEFVFILFTLFRKPNSTKHKKKIVLLLVELKMRICYGKSVIFVYTF